VRSEVRFFVFVYMVHCIYKGGSVEMKLLTAKEVSEVLQVTPARVYELARGRAIPTVRIGERQVRFDENALREWIARGGELVASEAEVKGQDSLRSHFELSKTNAQ
jgi:excisionase family DNA binding protein